MGPQFVRGTVASIGRIGGALADIASFVVSAATAVTREVVQGLIDVGRSLGDMIAAIAKGSFDLARKLL